MRIALAVMTATLALILFVPIPGPGRALAADKPTTAQFLARCAADAAACRRDVAAMVELALARSAACLPSGVRDDEIAPRVRAQIAARVAEDPPIGGDDYEDSALDAIGELWPCND